MQHRILAAFIMTLTATITTTSASGQWTDYITWVGTSDMCVGGRKDGDACTTQAECLGGTCEQQFGAWRHAGNWNPARIPLATDCVIIPDGSKIALVDCLIDSGPLAGQDYNQGSGNCSTGCVARPEADAVAYSVDFQGGQFDMNRAEALTITADSTIDGSVRLYIDATLKLDGDVTISGTGAISGTPSPGSSLPTIASATGSRTLTVGSGFTLDGFMLIDVALTNNGTVHANRFWQGSYGIILQRAPIAGTGLWTASVGMAAMEGVLSVEAAASGGGTWRLNEADTKIVFKAASTGLSSLFDIRNGVLDIQQNLTTTGDLNMSGGTIKVAKFKKALFSQ